MATRVVLAVVLVTGCVGASGDSTDNEPSDFDPVDWSVETVRALTAGLAADENAVVGSRN